MHNDRISDAKIISKYYLNKAKVEKNAGEISEGYILAHFNQNLKNALIYIDSAFINKKGLDQNIYPARLYLLRGNLYFRNDSLKPAFNNYMLGLKFAKEKNNKRQIAFANINIAYLNNYIGKHTEAAKILKFYFDNGIYLNENERNQIHYNLADTYIEINKMDSAKILIQKGIQFSLKNKNTYQYHQYLFLDGFYNLKLKKFNLAIEQLLKCKKFFAKSENDLNINYTLLNLGKAYDGLKEKNKAAESFASVDSIVQKSNNTFPELREVYTYLINYYKGNNNKEKQLYYIDRFLTVDKVLDSQFRYISRELPRQYDTPQLLKEKENIINDLQNRKKILYISISILFIGLLVLLYLYKKSKNSEKRHREIAQKLIHSIEEKNNAFTEPEPNVIITEISDKKIPFNQIESKSKSIPEEVVQFILKGLENFETKQQFLKKGITLSSLAKTLKTNSAYLSDVINTYKEKNFASYLNDLRINYALTRLVHDKKFRSYKLSVISEELGYNNEQAFSIAFKKKTGTTLSIYIKEVEKSHNQN
ncbi:helix-turn-helix domain-containing protein [Chryseobacterium daecheongense]|nr:helix-turn-helix domain-containing protein [Chryseobacterium daecheongense]